ncbi:MAG: hypothetical protein A2W03_18010 [Candidatus Aminicenantes bacterium RBG_16_63_16]|nr:MAG: hypothetical protein A2W03_18010 [Candidatus Aminicenantes bacterium RBG_16_63_16]
MIDDREFEDILKRVERPGRYIGGEWNAVRKNPAKSDVKVALVFPDVYEIGMSYLGQKILYSLLNGLPGVLAERVYAPWPDFEDALRRARLPLVSLENRLPLAEFDIVGVSLLYELNDSNILTILDLAGIPLLSEDRGVDFPLVIAGGPAAFNPEPLSDFFDAFVLGDGEEAFPEVIERLRHGRRSGLPREVLLHDLTRVPGVYVPRFYEGYVPAGASLVARRPRGDAPAKIAKRILRRLDGRLFPERIVVPDIQAVFDRVAIEVARGCPQRCRFCQATSLYFPFRVMRPQTVVRKAGRSLAATGFEDVSLSALSISDYPHLEPCVNALMDDLAGRRISLSLSSLRPGGLSPSVIENILRVRKTGFTLVPEAGTDRLRRVINKHLTNEEILAAAGHAFSRGWKLLKLYYMAGLPTETEADLAGIVELTAEIVRLGRSLMHSAPQINLSLSSFIPKPHTPFQWLPMDDERVLLEKQRYVRAGLRRLSSVKVKEHPTATSVLEAVFSRGDRRLAAVLRRAWRSGARFDAWRDQFSFSRWEEAFAAEGLDYRHYLGALPLEAPLPWDHIGTGIRKESLRAELERAMAAERTPSCLDADCRRCAGCETAVRPGRRFVSDLREKPAAAPATSTGNAGQPLRYEARYAKTGSARFLSHRDLTGHLLRAFRRAGVETAFSSGFHPKMLVSYGPALALGMTGKEEVFEFRSPAELEEKKCLRKLNRCLRPGIRFASLKRLDSRAPPLSERIRGMLFSIELDDPDVQSALDSRRAAAGAPGADDLEFITAGLAAALGAQVAGSVGLSFEKRTNRLRMELPALPRKGARPQDIIAAVFGLEYPAFYLTRERFLFADEPSAG